MSPVARIAKVEISLETNMEINLGLAWK